MSFIVAIDGPAGAGKGTITKLVGEKLGLGRDVVNAQLENFAQKANFAIAEVQKELSADFPHVVADPIFESILKKTQKIRQGTY